jgi:GT2 family glycosyltransferase
MNKKHDIAVVMVGLNTRDFVKNALESLQKADWGTFTHEIVYIDNASKDDTVEVVRREFPAVRVVQNTENIGFCRAANQGSALVDARYILHLNNDTLVYVEAIRRVAEFLDSHPEVAVGGSRLLNHDLSDQWSARRFPGGIHSIWGRRSRLAKWFPNATPVRRYLFKDELAGTEPFQVDWVGTPFMMVRSEAFHAAGGFPEDFYYWHEAIFCDRVRRRGGTTWVVPTAKVVHFEGKGGGSRPYPVRRWHIVDFHRGAYRFHNERHGLGRFHPRRWLAATGLATRAALLLTANWLDYRVRQHS